MKSKVTGEGNKRKMTFACHFYEKVSVSFLFILMGLFHLGYLLFVLGKSDRKSN